MVYQLTLPPPYTPPPLSQYNPLLPITGAPYTKQTAKTSLKNLIHVLSLSIAIIPNNFEFFVNCSSPGVEFLRYSSSERDRKFRRYSFTSSMKFQSRKFQVVVVQGREGDVPKSTSRCTSSTSCTKPMLYAKPIIQIIGKNLP